MTLYTLTGISLLWIVLFAINFIIDTTEVYSWVKGLDDRSCDQTTDLPW